MTEDKDLKRLVRSRMAKTGESYTAARAHFRPTGVAPPAPDGIDRLRALYTRQGLQGLGRHLESRYGIQVTRLTELDLGVLRFDRADGPSWVARVFPAARSIDDAEVDAAVLRFIEQRGLRAERCAHDEPISTLDDQAVLVTDYIEGVNARTDVSGETLYALGDVLGRLHSLSGSVDVAPRRSGAWHHISVNGGGIRDDVDTLLPLLADHETRVAQDERAALAGVVDALADVRGCDDMPQALIHPDPCGANAVTANDDGTPVLIDWAGAGQGPRVVSLGSLLAGSLQPLPGTPPSTDLRRVDAVIAGYRRHIQLTDAEIDTLAAAVAGSGIVISCWSLLFHDAPVREVANSIARRLQISDRVAERVAATRHVDDEQLTSWFIQPAPIVHPEQTELF